MHAIACNNTEKKPILKPILYFFTISILSLFIFPLDYTLENKLGIHLMPSERLFSGVLSVIWADFELFTFDLPPPPQS